MPRVVVFLLSLALFGAGCVSARPPTVNTQPVVSIGWQVVDNGIDRLDHAFASATGSRLLLFRFDPKAFVWTFANASSPKSLARWAEEMPDASFIANGVYFHEDQLPSGLLIAKGKRVGPRQFDLEKSGMIVLAPDVRIVDTKTEAVDRAAIGEGAQSYPLLVKDGQPAVASDSGQKARRTFFGLDQARRVYVGVVPDRPVSLYELSRLLLETDVRWQNVINLDGGPSSGFAARQGSGSWERIDPYVPVPNVLVAHRRR